MADESRIHPPIAVELLFEWKDDQSFIYVLAQQLHAPLPPRPELRTDVVHNRNAAFAHLPRHPPVEGRGVNHDGNQAAARRLPPNQILIEAENFRKMADDFSDPDDREIFGVDDNIAAHRPHALTSGAEKSD